MNWEYNKWIWIGLVILGLLTIYFVSLVIV